MLATRARFSCNRDGRRESVRKIKELNGIDYLEVVDRDATTDPLRQRTLLVRFLQPLSDDISRENVRIDGGVRITPIGIEWAFRADEIPVGLITGAERPRWLDDLATPKSVLVVRTDVRGDFSTYTLAIVDFPAFEDTPKGLDPRLSTVDFSFKIECPDDFDCRVPCEPGPPPARGPEIDYLAKDYATFRRLMLDRLSVTMPQWRDRNPADIQVALVELLASAADHLSYYQDAVATEAYLGTARRRTSVRRHARMLDYAMHDGCNARTWVTFEVEEASVADGFRVPARTALLGGTDRGPLAPEGAGEDEPFVFETLHDVILRAPLGELAFHAWGDEEHCILQGSTAATLVDPDPPGDEDDAARATLARGDVLIIEELASPESGLFADADRTHRQAVRLTRVRATIDPLSDTNVVEIEWHPDDALRFPLWVRRGPAPDGREREVLAIARGNVVLADHGFTVRPRNDVANPERDSSDSRLDPDIVPVGGRFRPQLPERNLTFGVPYDAVAAGTRSAASALVQDPREALPHVELRAGDETWQPVRDLLASDRFAPDFVVEVERDGSAAIRFGDDVLGKQPAAGPYFRAVYRVGGGKAGNIGADVLGRIAGGARGIRRVRNPLPATGGTESESMEEVRQFAPEAFRRQERAVTEADYAAAAERHPAVQRAVARFRWTGSWHTVFLTIDRKAGRRVTEDRDFVADIRGHIEKFRLAGYDIEVRDPVFVPLAVALRVCLKPGYLRGHVRERLLRVFSTRDLGGGEQGFFHPDRLTFGQPMYLSRIYDAAARVEGVASVEVVEFHRWGREPAGEIDAALIQPEETEVLRLDNDPSLPENGSIELDLRGGL